MVTRKADRSILRGITRTVLLEMLQVHDLTLVERPFTVAEAIAAREAFITSASQTVMPVVRIDGQPVGNGGPGPDLDRAARGFPPLRREIVTICPRSERFPAASCACAGFGRAI